MTALVSFFGMFMSLFSMGTSSYSQYHAMRAQATPSAQVEQYCPPGTQGQTAMMPDGGYRTQCLPQQAQP